MLLAARYSLDAPEQPIAENAFARTYFGRDLTSGSPVVLKVAKGHAENISREALLGARVHHPSLSSVIDFGIDRGQAYFVQHRLEGKELQQQDDAGALHRWCKNIAGALASLHAAGIVHGDVKPENILATPHSATLIDLGLAGQQGEALRGGTPDYLAPEQRDGEALSFAQDMFAFGRTFLEVEARSHRLDDVLHHTLVACAAPLAKDRPSAREVARVFGAKGLHYRRAEFARHFLGGRRLLRAVQELHERDAPRFVILRGARGSGKTRLLHEWAATIRFGTFVADFHPAESLFQFLERLAGGAPIRGPLDFPRLDAVLSQPTFILLDDLERLSEEEEELLGGWMKTAASHIRFVATLDAVAHSPLRATPHRELLLEGIGKEDLEVLYDRFPESRAELSRLEVPALPGDLVRCLFPRAERAHVPARLAPLRSLGFVPLPTLTARDPDGSALSSALEQGLLEAHFDGYRWTEALQEKPLVEQTPLPSFEAMDFDPFSARETIRTLPLRSSEELHVASYYALRIGNTPRALALGLRALRASTVDLRAGIRRTLVEIDARMGSLRARRTALRIPEGALERPLADIDVSTALLKHGLFEEVVSILGAIDPLSLSARWQVERGISLSLALSWLGKREVDDRSWARPLDPSLFPPRTRFRCLHAQAILSQREDRLDDAERHYRGAIALAEGEHLSDLLVSAHSSLATLYHLKGDLGLALETTRRAERYARAFSHRHAMVTVRINYLTLLLEIGAFQEIARAFAQAPEAFGSPLQETQWWSLRAEFEALRSDFNAGRAHLEKALAVCKSAGLASETSELALLELELRFLEGALAPEDLSGHTESADPSLRARALRLAALVNLRHHHSAESVRQAREAERTFEGTGEVEERARAALVLSQVLEQAGSSLLAEEATSRARRIWEERLATLEEPYRTMFREHPKRRALWAETRESRVRESSVQPFDAFPLAIALASAEHEKTLFRIVLDHAVQAFQVERAFILTVTSQGETRVACAKNIDQEEVKKAKNKFSRSLAEKVIRTGEPYLSGNATLDAPENASRSVHVLQLRSVLIVPIAHGDKTLGALYLDNRFRERAFSERDRAAALSLATLAAACAERLRAVELARLHQRVSSPQEEPTSEGIERRERAISPFPEFVTLSPEVVEVLRTVARIANTDVPALVRGESGTGKERIARLLHERSPRAKEPFVAINCAAMPEALLEAELFGYKRGAFTGATQDKRGLFVVASNGTLFLDELGEMPLAMQAKLLRVLQEKEVRPIGSEEVYRVQTRIVCATNRDLKHEIAAGRFREDLYYRVAVVDLNLPALRDRTEDIPLLADHFLARFNQEQQRSITFDRRTLGRMLRHPWPGNVRELENALRRACVLCDGETILPTDLMLDEGAPGAQRKMLDERSWLLGALERHQWNAQKTSKALGIPHASFYRKLRKHGITRPS